MAKRKYAPGLTQSERHRISDALYRLEKQGFKNVKNFDVSKITSAKSYDDIYKQVVAQNATLTFSPIMPSTGKQIKTEVSGKVGYAIVKAKTEYNKALNRAKLQGQKVADFKFQLAGYDPQAVWNYGKNQQIIARLVSKEINARTAGIAGAVPQGIYMQIVKESHDAALKRFEKLMGAKLEHQFKLMTRKLSQGPEAIYWRRAEQTRQNIISAMDKNVPHLGLRQIIVSALKSVNIQDFDEWFNQYSKLIQIEIFGYKGDILNNIEKWLPPLLDITGYPDQYKTKEAILALIEVVKDDYV